MIKAVLLDLDNTLISNPDYPFALAFLNQVEGFFRARLGIQGAAQHFRDFIKRAQQQTVRSANNHQLLIAILREKFGIDHKTLHDALDQFYASAYLEVESCISPIAGAAELIKHLLNKDVAVAIATNPLYPTRAIIDRMRWAGLPVDAPYALITGSEVMHTSKPDPAYFVEIIARIGIEPDEALYVGDSAHNDIQPAHTAGLQTFHVSPDPDPITHHSGSLSDLVKWFNTSDWQTQFNPVVQPDSIIPGYCGNLAALHGLLEEVQPHFWHQRPLPDEWSIMQILCHLLESEQTVQRPRLRRILSEDDPFIAAPRPPGPNIPDCADDGLDVMTNFVEERIKTIALLDTLTAEQWHRRARHSIFGLTTLLEMAHFTAQHDRLHINQLCQTLGRCS